MQRMIIAERRQILAHGEDRQHQFKRDVTGSDSVAAELAALSNTARGRLLIGVTDTGAVAGLNTADIANSNLGASASPLPLHFRNPKNCPGSHHLWIEIVRNNKMLLQFTD